MPTYTYSPMLEGSGNIRLLIILPNKNEDSPICCQLFHYPLQEGENHLYEALSYTWGSPVEKKHIIVNECDFEVTANLYSALKCLRNRTLTRIIWIDAICINQSDLVERRNQIRLMAEIYAQAHHVVIWLGDADNGNADGIREIRRLAGRRSETGQENESWKTASIFALLRTPWFRRVWVSTK